MMPCISAICDLRRQRNVVRLHRIGPRAFDELLRVIGAERSCMTQIETLLEEMAYLDPRVVEAVGGRDLEHHLVEVEGGRRR